MIDTQIKSNMKIWVRNAQIRYDAFSKSEKIFLNQKITEFNRKRSKKLAFDLAKEIGSYLGLENPFIFVQTEKWDGWFGIQFVADQTINKIKLMVIK